MTPIRVQKPHMFRMLLFVHDTDKSTTTTPVQNVAGNKVFDAFVEAGYIYTKYRRCDSSRPRCDRSTCAKCSARLLYLGSSPPPPPLLPTAARMSTRCLCLSGLQRLLSQLPAWDAAWDWNSAAGAVCTAGCSGQGDLSFFHTFRAAHVHVLRSLHGPSVISQVT